jgi:hypothetical protein
MLTSCLAPALGVTKISHARDMILAYFGVLLKSNLDFNKLASVVADWLG